MRRPGGQTAAFHKSVSNLASDPTSAAADDSFEESMEGRSYRSKHAAGGYRLASHGLRKASSMMALPNNWTESRQRNHSVDSMVRYGKTNLR